jgi:hypothetical protein
MPELGSYGSVRGAAGNSRPYRECRPVTDGAAHSGGRRPKTSNGDAMGQTAAVRKVRIWHSSALM